MTGNGQSFTLHRTTLSYYKDNMYYKVVLKAGVVIKAILSGDSTLQGPLNGVRGLWPHMVVVTVVTQMGGMSGVVTQMGGMSGVVT